jgi:hypothetical protein
MPNVQLRLSGISHVECWKLSNVSTGIAVAIIRVNVRASHPQKVVH